MIKSTAHPAVKHQKAILIAETIRESLDLKSPVDVHMLVKQLGGRLVETNDLPHQIDARIDKTEDTFTISINQFNATTRKRFSIAHEIGHLFLHMGYITEPEKWSRVSNYEDSSYTRFGYGAEEQEANYFAAELLMPRKEFLQAVKNDTSSGNVNLRSIAEHFQVSEAAARIRGISLGLIKSA